jgi:hypothetical protein
VGAVSKSKQVIRQNPKNNLKLRIFIFALLAERSHKPMGMIATLGFTLRKSTNQRIGGSAGVIDVLVALTRRTKTRGWESK